jgi:hypothetical protein
MARCYKCERTLDPRDAGLAMNLPGVTPGPVYFCRECEPPKSEAEIIAQLEGFIEPKRED